MQPKPTRPTGVTLLAVLAILGAIALLFSGAVLIGLGLLLGTLTASIDITNAITNAGYPGLASLGVGTISALIIALGAAILILGILYLGVGIGFLGGKRWAWNLGIIVSVIGIVLNVIQMIGGNYGGVVSLIISLLIIYYLMRPHVKVFFGKGTPMALRSTMPGTGSSTP
ncbi:MAG: hypothetical protein AUJ08_04020 [Thaumarchaeota archaeon 13_1_40CM_3_50_5]|nr:MAG: hypothetical protein AUJ08_04020 [Thaumarchaeota archaeon 13_1_40CM_3_50_5]